LDAPNQQVLAAAVQQLLYLQALEAGGDGLKLTRFGEVVVKLQASAHSAF